MTTGPAAPPYTMTQPQASSFGIGISGLLDIHENVASAPRLHTWRTGDEVIRSATQPFRQTHCTGEARDSPMNSRLIAEQVEMNTDTNRDDRVHPLQIDSHSIRVRRARGRTVYEGDVAVGLSCRLGRARGVNRRSGNRTRASSRALRSRAHSPAHGPRRRMRASKRAKHSLPRGPCGGRTKDG